MLKRTKSILLFGDFADGALYCVGHKSTYSSLPDDYNWYVLKSSWKKKISLLALSEMIVLFLVLVFLLSFLIVLSLILFLKNISVILFTQCLDL